MASRYQIVCMVVDRGSLKGAADELGYTQSAVSQAVKALDVADKAVPDKTGLSALKLYGKYAVALVRHGIQRLTDFIDPGTQGKRCLVGVGILQNHR